jgi:hypothetical protein
MSDLYESFEKRFTSAWFSVGWIEAEAKQPQEREVLRKDLAILESELDEINKSLESIAQKQLRLANLAKFYN